MKEIILSIFFIPIPHFIIKIFFLLSNYYFFVVREMVAAKDTIWAQIKLSHVAVTTVKCILIFQKSANHIIHLNPKENRNVLQVEP